MRTRKTRNQKKRKKTRTGVSLFLTILSFFIVAASQAPAQKQDKAQAVIAGTVFRDPGFALARAEVVLTVITPPAGKKPGKPQKILSDGRGEYAFYVPAGEAKYKLRASAPGLIPEEKEISVTADERVDVYFTLKPAEK